MKKSLSTPWDFLAEYKGSFFSGEWPSLPELFRITTHRYPHNRCFTIFSPDRNTLTYPEALEKISQLARYILSLGIRKGNRVAV